MICGAFIAARDILVLLYCIRKVVSYLQRIVSTGTKENILCPGRIYMLVPNCSDSEILNILSYPYIKSDLVSYLNVCIFRVVLWHLMK